jgi:hypothetical protein
MGVFMYKKVLIFIFFTISIVNITGVVYGGEIQENPIYYKKLSIHENNTSNNGTINKIQKITKSKSVFKTGTKITLRVYTDNSIKSVSGYISRKNSYKFIKSKSGYWYYNLNTEKFITGDYEVDIIAIDKKNKIYESSTYLTVDNVAPMIYSVSTNVKIINAGDSFIVYTSADNSTKKVVASVRGKNYSLKYSNDTWYLNTKLSYKEINTIIIWIYAYDSVGNLAKKATYIESNPITVNWQGNLLTNNKYGVYYPNPTNAYERSVKLLSKYATVYEGYAGSKKILGVTYRNSYGKKVRYSVTIAYKDPFVVYHELAHVLHWSWSEYNCDWYAYNKTAYWIK